MMKQRHRFRLPHVGFFGVVLIVGACSGITDPPEIVTVESTLEVADGASESITGSVAMVIGERQTQIGIGVEGGTEDAVLGWVVRNGSCSTTGERLGPASAFPSIEIDTNGAGDAQTVLFRRISPAGPYAAEVSANPDGTGSIHACADLVPGS
jgi:hypothetical protein